MISRSRKENSMHVPIGPRQLRTHRVVPPRLAPDVPAALGATHRELVRLSAGQAPSDHTREALRVVYGWPSSRR